MTETLRLPQKGVCMSATKKEPCHWPRCRCRVDLVWTDGYKNLPRPNKGKKEKP